MDEWMQGDLCVEKKPKPTRINGSAHSLCSGSAARSELERRRAHRPRGAETSSTVGDIDMDIDHITEAWSVCASRGEGGETHGGESRIATTSQTCAFGSTFWKRIITLE